MTTNTAGTADDPHRATESAARDLERQERKWGPVHRMVASLAALSAENHFTEKIIGAIRGESK